MKTRWARMSVVVLGVLGVVASIAGAEVIQVDGGRGPVEVYVPRSYDPAQPLALIVMLHGYGRTGQELLDEMKLETLAELHGFAYLAPDGLVNRWGFSYWNATDVCCDRANDKPDDSGYLRGLVEAIGGRISIAPERIHFIGFSNGAFMAYRMSCDHGDLVASMISVGGSTWADDDLCPRSEPTHVLHIHGTLDDTVLWDGYTYSYGRYPSVMGAVRRWVDGNGCARRRTELSPINLDRGIPGDETERTRWTSHCQPGGSVELWTVRGGGHGFAYMPDFPRRVVHWFFSHPKPGTWTDLGHGLAGTFGEPLLQAEGELRPYEEVALEVTGAVPFAPAFLVVGLDEVYAPFAGGTLVPSTDLIFTGLRTELTGDVRVSGDWPLGIPPGLATVYQFWIVDAGGPQGFSATAAVRAITP